MDEQTSWRGHGFTFFVFAGIVFLCATFFGRVVVVARSQAQKSPSTSAADSAKARAAAPVKVDFTYEDLKKDQPPASNLTEPAEEKPIPAEPETPREEAPVVAASVNIQV